VSRQRRAPVLACAAALALGPAAAVAAPPDSAFGTYLRNSTVCGGGSGFGDTRSRKDCRFVFEDKLEIGRSREAGASPDQVHVVFGYHFGQGGTCEFKGHGRWTKDRVVLERGDKPLPASCRLEVRLHKGEARLLDPKRNCSAALCSEPRDFHGIRYRKQDAKK